MSGITRSLLQPVRETGGRPGLIERFFRSLKEECVWQHRFAGFEAARHTISRWMSWDNDERPHQAFQYRSPRQFRREQAATVA
ncbi:MAG: integrase core domain-containing protein [Nitrospirales bacterium]